MGRRYLNIEIGAYLRDTQGLGAQASGAYLHLMMHYTAHGSLPTDDETLRTIARLTDQQWRRTKPKIAKFFDDQWRQPRLERSLAMQDRLSIIRTFAGQAGGRAAAMNRKARVRSVDK